MSYENEPTLGEVHRLCLRIEAAVQAQNGRVAALEKEAIRIKAYWSIAVVALGLGLDWVKHKVGLS